MTPLAKARITVTGGAGFLGTAICEQLRAAGVEQLSVPRRAQYDLTDRNAVRQMYTDTNPQVIIHAAATHGGIGSHSLHPADLFHSNLAMGLHLIDEARRHRVDKFVQIGTVCSYPKFAPVPFREEDLWSGYPDEATAPYGIAKRSILTMLQAYREQYGLNGIYLIPVNLYGPRADFNPATSHVVAALVDRFLEARAQGADEVVAWGTGSASREFLYVEDAARAIVAATERYNGDQAVNIGTGTAVTIRELVETIAELTGFQGTVVWDGSKPDGQPRRQVETSRAARLFGFDATTPLRDGLLKTIDWRKQQRLPG